MNHPNEVNYRRLEAQASALLSGVRNRISNAANFAALLYAELDRVNWVGFYFLEDQKLLLGPFQGMPACVEIPMGQGVCGTAAVRGETTRVANVHDFDGHIVCDVNSESEIVIPLFHNGALIGVLDIDSPVQNRFSASDEEGLNRLAAVFIKSLDS